MARRNDNPDPNAEFTVTFVPARVEPSPDGGRTFGPFPPGALAGVCLLQGSATGTAPLSRTAVELIGYIMRKNWVCPRRPRWMELWEMLPERDGARPYAPVPEIAWPLWDFQIRHEFLMGQIHYAEHRGVIEPVNRFLRALPREDWVEGLFSPV